MTHAELCRDARKMMGRYIKPETATKQFLIHDMLHDFRDELVWDQWTVRGKCGVQSVVMFVDGSTLNMATREVGMESHIIPR